MIREGTRRYAKVTYEFGLFDAIVVEIKALERLASREEAQLLNYLKATGLAVGLLINFGSTGKLEWKRMAFTRKLLAALPFTLS